MQLAMEIPNVLMKDLTPLCDLDFCLAQVVLDNPDYAGFYEAQAKAGRTVIMDNGFHELGHPLTAQELCVACDRVKPTHVIAPDWLDKPKETLEAYFEFRGILPQGTGIAVVLQGTSPAERADFFMKACKSAEMLCLPFKRPRFEWYCDLLEKIPRYVMWPPRIHLLGVNELWELKAFRDKFTEQGIPDKRVSVDTSKPIKFGLQGKRFTADLPLRGAGVLPQPKTRPAYDRMSDICYNIAFLRKYL